MSSELRTLGTFERVAYAYAKQRPYQFTMVARFAPRLSEAALAGALAAVQDSQPMLRVAVAPADSADDLPRFRPSAPRVPVRTVHGTARWENIASDAAIRGIDPESGPLVEAILVLDDDEPESCRVALTICHVVCDGRGALEIFNDLVASLNSERLPRHEVPAAQESSAGFSSRGPAAGGERPQTAAEFGNAPVPDPRPVPTIDPDLGRKPSVIRRHLTPPVTRALHAACRAHGVTVHAALCAAAMCSLGGPNTGVVNVGSAFDLRETIGLPPEVAVRFLGAHTVVDQPDTSTFWSLAQFARQSLAVATSPHVVDAILTEMSKAGPISGAQADVALCSDTHADILISNLGVYQPPPGREFVLTDLEGLALAMGVEGEQVLTVVTCHDTMWLTLVAREPRDGLLADIVDTLAAVAS